MNAKDFVAYVNANVDSNYNINKVGANEAWLKEAGGRGIIKGNTIPTQATQANTEQINATHTTTMQNRATQKT